MSAQIMRTIVFTKIIAFISYLDNLGEPIKLYLNPIPHEQNYSLFCIIGSFKDPKVSSSSYLQEGKRRCSIDHLNLLLDLSIISGMGWGNKKIFEYKVHLYTNSHLLVFPSLSKWALLYKDMELSSEILKWVFFGPYQDVFTPKQIVPGGATK